MAKYNKNILLILLLAGVAAWGMKDVVLPGAVRGLEADLRGAVSRARATSQEQKVEFKMPDPQGVLFMTGSYQSMNDAARELPEKIVDKIESTSWHYESGLLYYIVGDRIVDRRFVKGDIKQSISRAPTTVYSVKKIDKKGDPNAVLISAEEAPGVRQLDPWGTPMSPERAARHKKALEDLK